VNEEQDLESDSRFWMFSDFEKGPFGDATIAVVDEESGGIVAYFCDISAASDYVNHRNEMHDQVLCGKVFPDTRGARDLMSQTKKYIQEMKSLSSSESTPPLLRQRMLKYASALNEWVIMYKVSQMEPAESEKVVKVLDGASPGSVRGYDGKLSPGSVRGYDGKLISKSV
jgi:hypothetical protein